MVSFDPEESFVVELGDVIKAECKILQTQICSLYLIDEVCLNLGLNRNPIQANFFDYGIFSKLLIVEPNLVVGDEYVRLLEIVFVVQTLAIGLHFQDHTNVSKRCSIIVSLDSGILFRNALE